VIARTIRLTLLGTSVKFLMRILRSIWLLMFRSYDNLPLINALRYFMSRISSYVGLAEGPTLESISSRRRVKIAELVASI